MPDALRFPIFLAARNLAGILLASAVILHCGPGGIQVAGGTSEVGNPSNAITADRGKDEDTASTFVGVRFDVTGPPIRIIRERKPEKRASANDSASASTSVPDTSTQSPAN